MDRRRKPLQETKLRGVHHLALCTDDMKKTVDFYVDVLGMPLIHVMKVPPGLGTGQGNRGNPPYEQVRHYFFDMGNDSLLAFFEIPKGNEPAHNRNAIGAMQHVSFVVGVSLFEDIKERLKQRSIPNSGAIEQMPGLVGIYIYDPNGIRLEFVCQPADGEVQQVVSLVTQGAESAKTELASLPGVTPDWVSQRLAAFPAE